MNAKLVALALASIPVAASARDLKPGTFELGAGTNLSLGKITTEVNGTEVFDVSTTTASTDALYYVAPNFGIGLGLAYDNQTVDTAAALGGGRSESTQWTFGPEAKLNFPVSPALSFVLLGGVGLMKLEQDGASADGWAFLLGGGIRYFPADFVSLDALLQYERGSVSDDASNDIVASGWNVGLGFSFYFGGR